MLVQRILSFIAQLNNCQVIPDFDKIFLKNFEAEFLALQLDENEEIQFSIIDWKSIFSNRWDKIVDTQYDYTISDYNESNECWIKLAYDLSKITDKTYLQLLIPIAENHVLDPILLEHLAEHSADCLIRVLPKLPRLVHSDHVNPYVFIDDKNTLYYFKDNVPTVLIQLDESIKNKFKSELLTLMSGSSSKYLTGQQFNNLLISNGYYPRFELRNFYLSNIQDEQDKDGNHSLRCGRGLFVRMDVGCPLSTFDSHKGTNPRPLSLLELSRIKNKKGDLLFVFNGITYRNMWEAIINTEIIDWRMKGDLPAHVLPSLLKLVDLYFSESALGNDLSVNFRAHILLWSKQLQNCSIKNVNNLYGQVISADKKDHYLVEVLSDCVSCDHVDLNSKMVGLARWLCDFDASLIGEAAELRGLYKELRVGPFFTIKTLRKMVVELNNDEFIDTKGTISLLSSTLNGKEYIDCTVVESLRKIYQKHWYDMQETDADYILFSQPFMVMDPWLRLAQMLSGAGLLDTNYFVFLIPTLRPVSLPSLLSIRSKNESLYFNFLNETYENFGLYNGRSIVLHKQTNAACPRHLLPGLLDLVDEYFSDRRTGIDLSEFRSKLLAWSQHLSDCSIDEVNCLYTQKIQLNGTLIYLLDILLDSLQVNQSNLDDKFLGLARWLCDYDKSYIGQAEELLPVYKAVGVGPALSLKTLQQVLTTLGKGCSSKTKWHIKRLLNTLPTKLEIDAQVIEDFRALYEVRWLEVRYTKNDYIRKQTGVNAEWIRCAQLLSGSGYITDNYYCFLMPTLNDVRDILKDEPLHYYPLSHYIHEDHDEKTVGDRLLLVDNCVGQYKAVGTFYKPTAPGRLSITEMDRLVYSKFYKYKYIARWAEQDEPLNLSTILAVKDLVEALNPEGLKRLNYYEKLNLVEKAFHNFYCNVYLKLPDDERLRLDEQRIVFNDICQSFKETLDDVLFNEQVMNGKRGEGHCSALALQRFASLVIDYAPNLRFNQTIESDKKCRIKEMRLSSRLKIFRDFELIEQRTQELFFVLLTKQFTSYFESAVTVSIWDCSNSINFIAKQMFDKLLPMFESGTFEDATKVFAEIVDSLVKPALVDQSFITTLFRSYETKNWLQSIADDSLFQQQTLLYEPACLLDVFTRLFRKKSPHKMGIGKFLDLFMSIHAQTISPTLMKLQINLKFVKFFETFDEASRVQIRNMLQLSHAASEDFDFKQVCTNYILRRLNMTDPVVAGAGKLRFFSKTLSQDLDKTGSVREMIDKLITTISSRPKSEQSNKLLRYLHQIKSPGLEGVEVKRHSSMPRAHRA